MPGVFFVGADDTLTEMQQAAYLDEADLQRLIAKHPALLGSCTTEVEGEERSLLLVKQEIGIPDQEGGSDRWSMDHFYVDDKCVPTLVEVKRSTDPRIRREVVGQLLDYAANAASYWSIEAINARFRQQWGAAADETLSAFLEHAGLTEEEFWRRLQDNLEQGELRLVFVADQLPPQLKRVIEFLNGEMRHVEVLGLELRHFTDGRQRAIAPSLVGRTAQAAMTKQRRAAGSTNHGDLDAVEAAFRSISGGMPMANNTGAYRKVLIPGIDRGIHYEFLKLSKRITCEFHVETDGEHPELAKAMKKLGAAGLRIAGAPLEYFQRNRAGALRATAVDQANPAAIAQTMLELIRATRPELEQAAAA